MARLMIGAGGTGGHVYPALAVVEALHRSNAAHKVTFVGTRGGGGFEKRLVEASDVRIDHYAEVFAGPIVGVGIVRAASSLFKMGIGLLQALMLLLQQRPQAILMTGGWANIPLAFAGWILRVPMLVYLPDIEPGATIKLLSRFVQRVAITVPDAEQFFRSGQTIVTGYPLRASLTSATREAALAHFGLDPQRTTILVTGGSRGARNINIVVGDILPQILDEDVQILHVTGKVDYERACAQLADWIDHPQVRVFDYLDSAEMGLAFAAADIVIGRSGASSLGEFPYFGAASILVPYPYAWRYQRVNADWLVAQDAALRVDDDDMATALLPALQSLLHDRQRLQAMQAAARTLYTGHGAERIAAALLDLAEDTDD